MSVKTKAKEICRTKTHSEASKERWTLWNNYFSIAHFQLFVFHTQKNSNFLLGSTCINVTIIVISKCLRTGTSCGHIRGMAHTEEGAVILQVICC